MTKNLKAMKIENLKINNLGFESQKLNKICSSLNSVNFFLNLNFLQSHPTSFKSDVRSPFMNFSLQPFHDLFFMHFDLTLKNYLKFHNNFFFRLTLNHLFYVLCEALDWRYVRCISSDL